MGLLLKIIGRTKNGRRINKANSHQPERVSDPSHSGPEPPSLHSVNHNLPEANTILVHPWLFRGWAPNPNPSWLPPLRHRGHQPEQAQATQARMELQ